ncbi:MAG: CDP-alcohol phosphatidyltransferase family protein [Candidatus Kapabacteria bacterium]|nr:CDP-alcohol phosphatidyltransferase family protein [Candidatus Kapabacteria bacterium]
MLKNIDIKILPNSLSVTRIFLVLALIFLKPFSIEFLIVHFLCGITDVLDGYIARKFKVETKLGEKLDSMADIFWVVVLGVVLYPYIDVSNDVILCIAAIAILRLISIIIVLFKYQTLGILHTIGIKITAILLFLVPFFIQSDLLMFLICVFGSISAIEEFLIHLYSKNFNQNRKSIFYRS